MSHFREWLDQLGANDIQRVTLPLASRLHETGREIIQVQLIKLLDVIRILDDKSHNVRRMLTMYVFLVKLKSIRSHFPRQVAIFGVDTGTVEGVLHAQVLVPIRGRLTNGFL